MTQALLFLYSPAANSFPSIRLSVSFSKKLCSGWRWHRPLETGRGELVSWCNIVERFPVPPTTHTFRIKVIQLERLRRNLWLETPWITNTKLHFLSVWHRQQITDYNLKYCWLEVRTTWKHELQRSTFQIRIRSVKAKTDLDTLSCQHPSSVEVRHMNQGTSGDKFSKSTSYTSSPLSLNEWVDFGRVGDPCSGDSERHCQLSYDSQYVTSLLSAY